ncbi:MAG: hypothetical protein ACI8SE_001341, partial [Bacteroidia bacterium]
MTSDNFLDKYFWIIMILAISIQGIVMRYQARKYIKENPDLRKGYDDFLKGWLFIMNAPYLVIGFGILSGLSQSIWDIFDWESGNPITIAFICSVMLLYLMGINWIYLRGGAIFFEKHPGLYNTISMSRSPYTTSKRVKIEYFFMYVLL